MYKLREYTIKKITVKIMSQTTRNEVYKKTITMGKYLEHTDSVL